MRSLTVVLPASMWAMMPMLRRFGRSRPSFLVEGVEGLMTNLGGGDPGHWPDPSGSRRRGAAGGRADERSGPEKRGRDFAGNADRRQFGATLLSSRPRAGGAR